MAGGIGPPQDSERRALVGTSSKNPPKDEASLYELCFVPVQGWACRSTRQGSSMNVPAQNAGPPLTPRPARRRGRVSAKKVDSADAVINGAVPVTSPASMAQSRTRHQTFEDRP